MIEPRWLSVEDVMRLHEMQISEFGGDLGVADFGLLEVTVTSPRVRFSDGDLKDIVDLAAAYGLALSANHPFVDGNKRVSLHAMLVFLRLHGFRLEAPALEVTEMFFGVAAGRISETDVSAWAKSRLTS